MKIDNFLRLPYLLVAASSLFISTHSFSQGYEPPMLVTKVVITMRRVSSDS